jgi:hypothetical protein
LTPPRDGSPRFKAENGVGVLAVIVAAYGIIAYIVLPLAWSHYEHQKGLAGRIVGSVILDRPYRDAPVSPLYYDGRREDLAFEKPVGTSADRRHHVRFWEVLKEGQEGRPVWLGSVTFDRDVGLSSYTGQVTHHIAPDVDAERDGLTDDLKNARVVEAIYEVSGVGPTLAGRNGEGDRYYTDGEVKISRSVAGCNAKAETVVELDNPPMVKFKNRTWKAIAGILK